MNFSAGSTSNNCFRIKQLDTTVEIISHLYDFPDFTSTVSTTVLSPAGISGILRSDCLKYDPSSAKALQAGNSEVVSF